MEERVGPGRPKIEIDFETVKKLCKIQCTLEEIAGYLDCSEDTVERRVEEVYGMKFADFFKRHSAGGKMSLRRKQFDSAMGGNTALLIFLGKQYLGQSDKVEAVRADPQSNLPDSLKDEE